MSATQVKISKTVYDINSKKTLDSGTVVYEIQKGNWKKSLSYSATFEHWVLWSAHRGRVGVGMPKALDIAPEFLGEEVPAGGDLFFAV